MRWSKRVGGEIDTPKVDEFLKDIEEVCQRHSMTISHEDGHGAFIIEPFNEDNIKWLHDAHEQGAEKQ